MLMRLQMLKWRGVFFGGKVEKASARSKNFSHDLTYNNPGAGKGGTVISAAPYCTPGSLIQFP